MKLHEYKAKSILRAYHVPVPRGAIAETPEQSREIVSMLNSSVVIKAQVLAGGRGEGGGVYLAHTPEEAFAAAQRIIGMRLVTPQTGSQGTRVRLVLVEEAVLSRSGTLTYEVIWQLTRREIGQSTAIGIGGDAIVGSSFVDLLELLEHDAGTEAIVLIGEIGGSAEEEAAEYIQSAVTKPVAVFVAGRSAPEGRRMGHAGAIIAGGKGNAENKIEALERAGVLVITNPAEIGNAVAGILARTGQSV
jgi:succinyl-CoA synthetase alpha subunit